MPKYHKLKYRGLSITDLSRDWASADQDLQQSQSRPSFPWSPPPTRLLKLNFDGSCKREEGLAGYGGLISNNSGLSLLSFAGPIQHGTVIEAELFALWRSIMELAKLGVQGSIVE